MALRDLVDTVLEATVVPSFTRIGPAVRRRLDDWSDPARHDLTGRVVLVTGATSGLGRAAAEALARAGATVVLNGRSAERNQGVVDELAASTGSDRLSQLAADLGDLTEVRALAQEIFIRQERLDVLIHNAGSLSDERRVAPDGTEATVASQVVGPFLLTSLLLGLLQDSSPARVLTMSSGGMYTQGLTVSGLEMGPADYNGSTQYARAKRAQVTLNEVWAQRFGHTGVHFHAMHPGWADTPGVTASLPTFDKVMGPLLRPPEEGADTMVWLAADDGEPLATNGGFWLDRRQRSIHKLPTTRRTDSPERRARLWNWVSDRAGIAPSTPT